MSKKDEVMTLGLLGDYSADMDSFDGLDLDQSELIRVEKFSMMQPTSLEVSSGDVKAGVFYNSASKEKLDKINFFPIFIGKARVMWPENFKRGDKPICRSEDARRSIDGATKCAECPHSQWNNDAADPRPRCNESSVIFGIIHEPDKTDGDFARIFRITGTGSSIMSVRDLGAKLYRKKRAIYTNLIEMKGRFEKNDKGAFYVLEFNDPKEWSDVEQEILKGKDLSKLKPAEIEDLKNELRETMEAFKTEQETTIKAYRQDNPDYNDEQIEGTVASLQIEAPKERTFEPSVSQESSSESVSEGALGSF